MSRIAFRMPVNHTPSFKLIDVPSTRIVVTAIEHKLNIPFGVLDYRYYTTDAEGWGKILYDLAFSSSLYATDKFDCENYAFKAMTVCAERYGLNTMGVALGQTPMGRHGFNIFYIDKNFMLWEPNEGYRWSGEPFKIGENGYIPDLILI